MTSLQQESQFISASAAHKALNLAAQLWFITAVIGLWIFVFYLLALYGGSAVRGDIQTWNTKLTHGYVPGDTLGNLAVIAHLALAVIILVLGPLQLIPKIRAQFPVFHRWSGRVYLPAVLVTSIAGLYMLWVHGTAGGIVIALGMSLDAMLIILFGGLALRAALARDFKTHSHWALRLFMVVNAVWFFRVGLMLWLIIHQSPVGFNPDTFEGPFVTFMAFAQYLVPLLVLELYWCAKNSANVGVRMLMALVLVLLTLAMAAGIFGAIMGLWLPNI